MRGTSEGEILRKVLSLAGIPCSYRLAVDIACFVTAIVESLIVRLSASKGAPPSVIHLSAHGDKDALRLRAENV